MQDRASAHLYSNSSASADIVAVTRPDASVWKELERIRTLPTEESWIYPPEWAEWMESVRKANQPRANSADAADTHPASTHAPASRMRRTG